MEQMKIKARDVEYAVHFCDRIDLSHILTKDDVIVIDRYFADLYRDELNNSIEAERCIFIDATEDQKSYIGIIPVIEELIQRGFRKKNRLLAVGGGITQDVVAFTASILYRGVEWNLVPTTLLAQCDSCIGSKTSVNFGSYKNQVGGFYPPRNIYIAPRYLKTLRDEDIKSGLGEMLHYYVVGGEKDFAYFESNCVKAMHDTKIMQNLIMRSLQIKKSYIEIDEFDRNERQIFNYGHTFGHALESATNYRVPHGIAVSYGMDMANTLAVKIGIMDEEIRDRIRNIAQQFWDDNYLANVDMERYIQALSKDKKNEGKKLAAILCSGFGNLAKQLIDMDEEFIAFIHEYLQGRF